MINLCSKASSTCPSRGLSSTLAMALAACAAEPSQSGVRVEAIIGGGEASEHTGLAQVSHAGGDRICTATLIARRMVVTAKHCVFRSSSSGDELLPAEGFRIGFGPDSERFVTRGVAEVAWIGMPDALSVEPAVVAGEDVAVLHLDESAPDGELTHAVDLGFQPAADQLVHMAGYGLTDLRSGRSGTRTIGMGRITGYEADTGIVQISGDSICFGDSGGPVLDATSGAWIGVLGEVGGSGEMRFCDVGLSFAATPANPAVRRLLARECASVGGCDAGQSAPARVLRDAGAALAVDASSRVDASSEADATADAAVGQTNGDARSDAAEIDLTDSTEASRGRHDAGCSASRPAGTPPGWLLSAFSVCAALARRRGHLRLPRGSTRPPM